MPNRGGAKQNHNQLIKAARSANEVFAALESIPQLDVVHISIAVSALGRMRGEWKRAVELLRS